jgi:2'-5' RNA ligase
MKKDSNPLFVGQKLYEYLLIISPDEIVKNKINTIKILFSKEYGCKNAENLKPHVTMINFLQYESAEYRIVNCFEKFAKTVMPFNITLNGFGNFEPHTIYAKLESTTEVITIVKDIRTRFKNLLTSSESLKPNFTTKSHLTIARGMTQAQYEQAWERWQKEYFLVSFKVNQMNLIKRELNPKDLRPIGNYKPVQDFIFSAQFREEQMVLL